MPRERADTLIAFGLGCCGGLFTATLGYGLRIPGTPYVVALVAFVATYGVARALRKERELEDASWRLQEFSKPRARRD